MGKVLFVINWLLFFQALGIKQVYFLLPIFQLTEKEEITNRKTQADSDKIYIDMGAVTSDEIRESRFANGYSYETILDEETDEGNLEVGAE